MNRELSKEYAKVFALADKADSMPAGDERAKILDICEKVKESLDKISTIWEAKNPSQAAKRHYEYIDFQYSKLNK